MNNSTPITVEAKTVHRYNKRYLWLRERYERETGELFSAGQFIEWLSKSKPSISTHTWRQYKASCVYCLKDEGFTQEASDLLSIGSDGCLDSKTKREKNRTSSQKQKSFGDNELERLTEDLVRTANSSFFSKPVLAIINATLITGLRPIEWQFAELLPPKETGEHYILRVKNAKNTNGRAHGDYRHLLLKNYTQKQITFITLALRYMNPNYKEGWLTTNGEKAEDCDAYIAKLQKRLYFLTKAAFPNRKNRPTIYSARHQFIANLKANKYPLTHIAALVGHGTDETATEHYGKARYGSAGRVMPEAAPDEVERIKEVAKLNSPSKSTKIVPTPSPSI